MALRQIGLRASSALYHGIQVVSSVTVFSLELIIMLITAGNIVASNKRSTLHRIVHDQLMLFRQLAPWRIFAGDYVGLDIL